VCFVVHKTTSELERAILTTFAPTKQDPKNAVAQPSRVSKKESKPKKCRGLAFVIVNLNCLKNETRP
jgi:hypothetical protein